MEKMDNISNLKTLIPDIEDWEECQSVFPDNTLITLLSGQDLP